METAFYRFLERIGLEKEAVAVVARQDGAQDGAEGGAEAYGELRRVFDVDEKGFLAGVGKRGCGFALYYYCRHAYELVGAYRERGISEGVYIDTFADIALWERLCLRETGERGLKETEWLALHLKMELFKLGRMQYQTIVLAGDVNAGGRAIRKGSEVYGVHIPRGEAFGDAEREKSYRAAEAFFKRDKMIFRCDSWMLSPVLKEVLPPESNILRFARDYRVSRLDPANRAAERFVFGKVLEPADLPAAEASTSLQRAVLRRVKEGRPVGTAEGFYFRGS
ncbi:MAG: acyltransferase domain-containing protein [Clostridiales bacterium]|jgi:hypothetical protein|nr:acyltransferase domain-containing protein [Clostridiales bacterium]